MKVLMRIRSDVETFPGGDYIQLLETKTALEELDVTCDVAPGLKPVAGRYDVVHLFNTTRIHETYLQFLEAKAKGLPVVLSPIWHSLEDMRGFYSHLYHLPFFPISTYLAIKEFFYARRSRLPVSLSASLQFSLMQKKIIANCDAILPNSKTELEVITRESGIRPKAGFISPLGIKQRPRIKKPLDRRDVICAGRIEPRKNQLSVVRAFKRLRRGGSKLRLFGQQNQSHPRYCQQVLSECVEGWVEYGGSISQETLLTAYEKCTVVVLMSFFETFGLAALEGLSMGATICVSDTAYNRGIYGDHAVYADPYSEDAIAQSIAASINLPPVNHDSFLEPYTWDNTARTTMEAYRYVSGS